MKFRSVKIITDPSFPFLTFLDHLLVQGRPLFQSSSIFDLVPCLQSVGISSCLPVCCPSSSLCRAGQYFSHPVFLILCHVFSQSVFLHVFLYVVPPAPCAGSASISVIQYFWSCAMSSVSRYFFMSSCMLSLQLLVQGRPVFQSSSIFDLVPCLQSVGISSCLPVCCPSSSLCRAGHYFSHPVFSILCHVFSQSVFLHVFLYVVPPAPCAGPAIISVIQYFRSCAMSSVSRYFFMSSCMLSLQLLVQGRPVFQSSSIFDLVPCLQSVGISSCPSLCCSSVYFSVDLCSFSQKLLVATIMQFSPQEVVKPLLFSRKVSTGFTCASFLMSSFLHYITDPRYTALELITSGKGCSTWYEHVPQCISHQSMEMHFNLVRGHSRSLALWGSGAVQFPEKRSYNTWMAP